MAATGQKPKILIVDDEADLVEIYVSVFSEFPLEIVSTTSSKEALKMIEEQEFASVITDLNMPDVTGVQLMKAISGSKLNSDCPIYIVSGFLDDVSIEKLAELKVCEAIPKPLDFIMLATKVWEKIKLKTSLVKPTLYSSEVANIFSNATRGVFDHYFGQEAGINYQDPFVKTEQHKDSFVAALLPIFGKTCFGSALLGMNKEMLAGLLGSLYGEDEVFEDMVPYADVVGEMINQVSGRFKTDMYKSGIFINVGVPILHFENIESIRHLVSGRPMVFPLSLKDRHAYSEMCFGDLSTGNTKPEAPKFEIFAPKKAAA